MSADWFAWMIENEKRPACSNGLDAQRLAREQAAAPTGDQRLHQAAHPRAAARAAVSAAVILTLVAAPGLSNSDWAAPSGT